MAREHWMVCRRPVSSPSDWVLAIGTGTPLTWDFTDGGSTCAKWAGDALREALRQSVSIDVSITGGDPVAAMADPDEVAAGRPLMLICRETRTDLSRWVLLNMDPSGEFRVGRVAVGKGLTKLINDVIGSIGDDPADKSMIWLRPDWFSTDILDAKAA